MCSFSFFRWILWSWQKVSCAFYNQNQLNLNLLRPTLANSGRMSDGSEIRLDYHEENEYKDAELHIGVVCYCLLDLRLPKVSDFDPNFPSCVRVSLLQVAVCNGSSRPAYSLFSAAAPRRLPHILHKGLHRPPSLFAFRCGYCSSSSHLSR